MPSSAAQVWAILAYTPCPISVAPVATSTEPSVKTWISAAAWLKKCAVATASPYLRVGRARVSLTR